jgi:hypothetical protein
VSVEYGVTVPFVPFVCVVYTCRCGRRSIQHGLHAGETPSGWTEHEGDDPICKKCAELDAARRRQQRPAT